ncbi:MAG TPA: J domain-containing protein [Pyrinomonadaceae bacterium]|nr:J domain-containing protein [Pyrinomonadaceae bacterium]
MAVEQGAYKLLGVKRGASITELKVAYRDLVKECRPDSFGHNERLRRKAKEKLKEIHDAYEQLVLGRPLRPKSNATDRCYSRRPAALALRAR